MFAGPHCPKPGARLNFPVRTGLQVSFNTKHAPSSFKTYIRDVIGAAGTDLSMK